MNAKRITRAAMLSAIALTIFLVELQLPALAPIPGVKLGLSNVVTVYAMFLLGPGDTLGILLTKILLGSIFSGRVSAVLYSLAGGLLCYLFMLALRKLVTTKQIWVCSAVGAVAHNIGQILAAIFITQTPGLMVYLPILVISGILTGSFTGLCAQLVVNRSDVFRQVI